MKLAVFLLSVVTLTCALPSPNFVKFGLLNPQDLSGDISPRVINGHEVIPHSIPYQVWLIIDEGDWLFETRCSGSLITSKYVMTAGHCVNGHKTIDVLLGAHNISKYEEGQKVVKAVKWFAHDIFDLSKIDNDIGLIELETAVYPDAYIEYATLPSRRQAGESLVGSHAMASGWGRTINDQPELSDVLMEVSSVILENSICNASYGVVRDNELCLSGQDGKGVCRGDSGGPLVINGVQHGIASYASSGCQYGYPTMFANVGYFLDWIEKRSDWRSVY